MPFWPAELPPPALNSLQEMPPDNVIRTSMDRGPDKIRRRTTANVRPLSFTLNLESDLLDVLDEFYNTTTFSGAIQFDYTHPRTLAACQARFTAPPQYSEREGMLYSVAVQLEILP